MVLADSPIVRKDFKVTNRVPIQQYNASRQTVVDKFSRNNVFDTLALVPTLPGTMFNDVISS